MDECRVDFSRHKAGNVCLGIKIKPPYPIKNRLCSPSVVTFNEVLGLYMTAISLILDHTNLNILRVVSHGCETWLLTLRDEDRFRAFDNRELRRIFGPKRSEVAEGQRKVHNDNHNNLCSSSDITIGMRSAGRLIRVGR
jgi:hypothetical protein